MMTQHARDSITRAAIARRIATAAEGLADTLNTPAARATARAARRAADKAVYHAVENSVYDG